MGQVREAVGRPVAAKEMLHYNSQRTETRSATLEAWVLEVATLASGASVGKAPEGAGGVAAREEAEVVPMERGMTEASVGRAATVAERMAQGMVDAVGMQEEDEGSVTQAAGQWGATKDRGSTVEPTVVCLGRTVGTLATGQTAEMPAVEAVGEVGEVEAVEGTGATDSLPVRMHDTRRDLRQKRRRMSYRR